MFFSNVVQFSRSFAAALSSTASLLYHPLPLLSTPFLYLFSLPVPTPVCLVNFFQLIVENLCLLLFNIYYKPVTISHGYASVLYHIKGLSFLVIFKLFSPKGENLRQKVSPNFSSAMLEFSLRMLYNICHSVCACSSVDRVFDSDSKDRGFESRQARLNAPPESLNFIGMAGELFLYRSSRTTERKFSAHRLFA